MLNSDPAMDTYAMVNNTGVNIFGNQIWLIN